MSWYNALAERYQNAADRFEIIEAECASCTPQRKMFTSFAKQLTDRNEWVAEFTPTLRNAMVEKVTVDADGILHFTFKNGTVLCAWLNIKQTPACLGTMPKCAGSFVICARNKITPWFSRLNYLIMALHITEKFYLPCIQLFPWCQTYSLLLYIAIFQSKM